MGILVIGKSEQAAIDAAVSAALAKPIPWAVFEEIAVDSDNNTLLLDERKSPDRITEIRREYPPQNVQLGTYRVAISFEWQPAGLMRHLSVSSHQTGKVPNEHAMRMLADAFGFSDYPPIRPYRTWVEEFEPGHMAINLVELEP